MKSKKETKQPRLKCDVQTLSLAFGITDRQIQKLSAAGILPKAKRGEYDFVSVTNAYLNYLRNSFKQSENKTTLELENIREKKLMNDDREFEAVRKRGSFTLMSWVEEFFDNLIPQWNSQIDSIERRIKNFIRQNSDIEKNCNYVETCFTELRNDFAAIEPARFINPKKDSDDAGESEDVLQPVGGQVQKIEQGSK